MSTEYRCNPVGGRASPVSVVSRPQTDSHHDQGPMSYRDSSGVSVDGEEEVIQGPLWDRRAESSELGVRGGCVVPDFIEFTHKRWVPTEVGGMRRWRATCGPTSILPTKPFDSEVSGEGIHRRNTSTFFQLSPRRTPDLFSFAPSTLSGAETRRTPQRSPWFLFKEVIRTRTHPENFVLSEMFDICSCFCSQGPFCVS